MILPVPRSERILVAADESTDGRKAVQAARALAANLADQLELIRILPPGQAPSEPVERARFRAWLGNDAGVREIAHTERVRFGVPGIEIVRAADEIGADLIVLGRRPRTPSQRLVLGETADAVVRRSDRPVLFVSGRAVGFERVLIAVDGADRSVTVLEQGWRLARRLEASVTVVTVEPAYPDELATNGAGPPGARSLRLDATLARLASPEAPPRRVNRRGNPIEEVLQQCIESQADVLVIGYRRGGPPRIFGPTEVARNLLYAAPCSVYTVPL